MSQEQVEQATEKYKEYRDQLQDSQVWLPIQPERCASQILLHAAHQFADGSVYHWWHPLSEQGLIALLINLVILAAMMAFGWF